MSSFESFIVTDAPEQRTVGGIQVPFVLSPPSPLASVVDASQFVKSHRNAIDQALHKHGAVLFRGFPLDTAQDFDTFVRSWEGWQDLSYERSMSFAVRHKLSDRICTTNEGKSGGLVFHHEQAQTPLWPSHVFFCCLLPAQPGDGGATGIVSSDLVYEKLKERHPSFMESCETHGVRYTIYAGPKQDATKGAGRSWKSFFHAETKEECEVKLKAGGWDWEWGVGPSGSQPGPDFLKCTTPVLDAVKVAPGTSKKCFFNQLIATTANALEFSRVGTEGGGYDLLKDIPTQEGIDACVCFGNGDTISLQILLDAKRICEELAIDVCWQKGDVALISNYLMMHARRPWNGPEGTRKLLASLVAEEHCTSFGKPLVAL
jgi:alpha-ketoglutarate-dependent taurine dioxygenase